MIRTFVTIFGLSAWFLMAAKKSEDTGREIGCGRFEKVSAKQRQDET